MRRLSMVSVLVAAVVALAACSEPEPVSSAEGVAAAGETGYAQYCAECHGDRLEGADDGPSLLEDEYLLPGYTDEQLWRSIRSGRSDPEGDYEPMPGFPNIGRQTTADIMAYVRSVQSLP